MINSRIIRSAVNKNNVTSSLQERLPRRRSRRWWSERQQSQDATEQETSSTYKQFTNYSSSFSFAAHCWFWWIIYDIKMKTWLIINDNYDRVLKIVSKFWMIRILILSHVALIIFCNSKKMFGGWSDPNLACAEQDWFGMMTLLRLIRRLTQEGVSDTVPERVTFHCTCGRRESQKFRRSNQIQWLTADEESPWVKFNSPPPSVVPAAKLWPRAGLHVLAWHTHMSLSDSVMSHFVVSVGSHVGTDRMRAVDLDCDICHVDPLMSRLQEACYFFLCTSVQLLQGAEQLPCVSREVTSWHGRTTCPRCSLWIGPHLVFLLQWLWEVVPTIHLTYENTHFAIHMHFFSQRNQ